MPLFRHLLPQIVTLPSKALPVWSSVSLPFRDIRSSLFCKFIREFMKPTLRYPIKDHPSPINNPSNCSSVVPQIISLGWYMYMKKLHGGVVPYFLPILENGNINDSSGSYGTKPKKIKTPRRGALKLMIILKGLLNYFEVLIAFAIAAICSGVLPQQPPTTRAPRAMNFKAAAPICCGVTS